MRGRASLAAVGLALSAVACGSGDDASSSSSLLATVASNVQASTTPTTSPYEPVEMPFPSRAWLNRADGSLVVESCQEADAFVAQGHALYEVVEYRSYACGPTVTSKVVAGDRGVADLFARR